MNGFVVRLALLPMSFEPLAATPAPPAARDAAASRQRFQAFLDSLLPLAAARGLDRPSVLAIFRDLSPDPAVAVAPARQNEFERPISAYFRSAVASRRIAEGRALATRWRTELDDIARRFGVPGSILLAAWGMESDFGRDMGHKDILRSLATLAFLQPDRSLFRTELVDALVMLIRRGVPRQKLTGSWAGAMGGPQFLPSAYLAHAVSYAGTAAPDIWSNVPDILASIAAFLKASGWQSGVRWGFEVRLPAGFTYATLQGDFGEWRARGFAAADGGDLPASGPATLYFPEGAAGPAFLLGNNYWVIKAYNNSDAYALSFACLADQIGGAPPIRHPWPLQTTEWRREEKAEMQRLLERLGYYKGIIDGRFGPTSRDAIHAFQRAIGDQPADGIGGADLLDKMRQRAGQ